MSKVFEISPTLPIRFIKDEPANILYNNPSFDGEFSINSAPKYKRNIPYYQKYNFSDSFTIQLISDYGAPTIEMYYYNQIQWVKIQTFGVVQITDTFIGKTFKVYECNILPNIVSNEGFYYFKLSYFNSDISQTINYYSEIVHYRDNHEDTVLIEYTNSDNDFSIFFTNGWIGKIRVEGTITDFVPVSDDIIYTDQIYNSTQINSIPSRVFRFYVGGIVGIPEWMADKINRAFACDQKKIDGIYYEKISGAKWEVKRQDEYYLVGLSIEITETENKYLLQLNVQPPEAEEVKYVQKVKNYFNIGADFVITGIFKKYSLLEKIAIINYNTSTYTIKIGTTPLGSNIGEFVVSDVLNTLSVNWYFGNSETIYISGINGVNDISLIYKQIDEPAAPTGDVTILTNFPRGMVIDYEEATVGDFFLDFDTVTGLGKTLNQGGSGLYVGWAIMDGRNGTSDNRGRFRIGWDNRNTNPNNGIWDLNYNTRGMIGGEKMHQLTIAEMARHRHGFEGVTIPSGGGDGSRKSVTQAKFTDYEGDDQPHNNIPPYLVCVPIKKIV